MAIERKFGRKKESDIVSLSKVEGLTIMGVDPGTNFMGFGIIKVSGDKPHLVGYGTIKLDTMSDPYEKLKAIFVQIGVIIEEYKPDEIALEAPFYGVNVQSMLKLGRAQGVAMSAALSRGIDVFEYAPTAVKQSISGSGRASKEQVATMVGHLLGAELKADKFDATDALAVAICHYFASNSPLPTKNRGTSFKTIVAEQLKNEKKV